MPEPWHSLSLEGIVGDVGMLVQSNIGNEFCGYKSFIADILWSSEVKASFGGFEEKMKCGLQSIRLTYTCQRK
jgi:hypothetical protein